MSEQFKLDQDSCIGPVEFTEYSSQDCFSITDLHLGHAYVDDHQFTWVPP